MNDRTDPTAAEERRSSPDRILALVDGTFAIIMTILVLEIGVPSNLSEQSLRGMLMSTVMGYYQYFQRTGEAV